MANINGGADNRECVNCLYPCQGGESLHRRGYCCHSYCPCQGFVEARNVGIWALRPKMGGNKREKKWG